MVANNANVPPMQLRGPDPNGVYEIAPAGDAPAHPLHLHRDGRLVGVGAGALPREPLGVCAKVLVREAVGVERVRVRPHARVAPHCPRAQQDEVTGAHFVPRGKHVAVLHQAREKVDGRVLAQRLLHHPLRVRQLAVLHILERGRSSV